MFLKGKKFRLPFIDKEKVTEEDIGGAKEADTDLDAAADALFTPVRGVVDNQVAQPVNTLQPLSIDEDDKAIAKEADALLTPMEGASSGEQVVINQVSLGGNVEEEKSIEGIAGEANNDELKDVFPSSPGPEEPATEAVVEAPAEEKKDNFMDGLFDEEEEEEESSTGMLIASLPDIDLSEVVDVAAEVKTLMLNWQPDR